MTGLFNAVGGRKFLLLAVSLVLVALKETLGLDDETINKIVVLAIGGSGAIALEDGLVAIGTKTAKK